MLLSALKMRQGFDFQAWHLALPFAAQPRRSWYETQSRTSGVLIMSHEMEQDKDGVSHQRGMKYVLYAKGMQQGNIVNGQIANFLLANTTNGVGATYRIFQILHTETDQMLNINAEIEVLQNTLEQKEIDLVSLEQELINITDPILAKEKRLVIDAVAHEIGMITEQISILSTDYSIIFEQKVSNAQSEVATIIPANLFEQRLKQMLSITLNRSSSSAYQMNDSEMQELLTIAQLCPETDGFVVQMANYLLGDCYRIGQWPIEHCTEIDLGANLACQIIPIETTERSQRKVASASICNNLIVFDPNSETALTYTLFDALGRSMQGGVVNQDSVPIEGDLPAGIYFLVYSTNRHEVFALKLVKTN